jgi:hypothetical protein
LLWLLKVIDIMPKPFIFALFLLFANATFGQIPDSVSLASKAILNQLSPSDENCKFYRENEWLPDAFINNATCACLKIPNTEEANTIRYYLKIQLDSLPDELKILAQQKKNSLLKGELSKRKYRRFIIKNLTKPIYDHHVYAYSKAGCKGTAAPYQAWKMITTKKVKDCDKIWLSIKCFGPCSGRFGKW